MVPDDTDAPAVHGDSTGSASPDPESPPPFAALYDPDGYFRSRAPDLSLSGALAVAVAAAFLGTVVFGAGIWLVAENVTGTVPVDNPERPPDAICEGDPTESVADRCEQPETVDRRVGAMLWKAFSELLPFLFLGVLIIWPVYGAGLHVAGLVAGGDGSIRDSVAIAAWGLVPTALSLVAVVAIFWTLLVGPDFSATTPGGLEAKFEPVLASLSSPEYTAALVVVGIGVTAWQTYVWGYGLAHAHDLSTRRAMAAAGTFAVLAYLVGMAL